MDNGNISVHCTLYIGLLSTEWRGDYIIGYQCYYIELYGAE